MTAQRTADTLDSTHNHSAEAHTIGEKILVKLEHYGQIGELYMRETLGLAKKAEEDRKVIIQLLEELRGRQRYGGGCYLVYSF